MSEHTGEPHRVWASEAAHRVWDLTEPPPDWTAHVEELLGTALPEANRIGKAPLLLVLTEEELRTHAAHAALRRAGETLFGEERPRLRVSPVNGHWPGREVADPYAGLITTRARVEVILHGGTRIIGRLKRPLEAPTELLEVALDSGGDALLVRRYAVQDITPVDPT